MSATTSTFPTSVAKLTLPLVPTFMVTRFGMTVLALKLSAEPGSGIPDPVGYTVMNDCADDSTAVVGRTPPDPARHRAAGIALRQTLQRLALLQEGHWATMMTYAPDVASLDIEMPRGIRVAILAAGVGGWRALAYDYSADAMCGIAVGREVVGGWKDGVAVCE